MSAFSKNKKTEQPIPASSESPESILERRRILMGRVGGTQSSKEEPTGMAAEKAKGALCYLPISIHRLASRYAEDHDLTAKRFFYEILIQGLEQRGVITPEQSKEALELPKEYGWISRKQSKTEG